MPAKKKDAKASADATTVAAPASEATPTAKPPFAKSSRGPTPEAMAEFERLQQQPLINWRGVLMVIGVLAFSYFAQKLTMPEPPQPPSPFPPAHVTCYGEGVIEPKQQHSTATPTSMQSWVLEAGANGTVWAKKEDGAQHCYPHSSNIIDGVPHPPWLKQERVERLAAERETMLRAGDVLIASFPRSGTSWMEQIVLLLLNQGDASKLNPEHHNELAFDPARRDRKGPGVGCVWMERFVDAEKDFGPPDVQLYEFASLASPRVVKTHALPMLLLGREPPTHKMHFAHQGEAASLPPPLLPQGVRVIYLSREPKDVVLSSYHHPAGATSPANTGWPLDAFVALWAAGKVEHGEWSDHVCAWARYAAAHELHEQGRKASGKATDPRRVTRFLEVRYEELQADLRSEVRKVADLLGMGDADDALIDAVVAASGFDAMKRQANNAPHLREGKAGGGGAAFGRQLTKEFDATFRERVAKCGLKL